MNPCPNDLTGPIRLLQHPAAPRDPFGPGPHETDPYGTDPYETDPYEAEPYESDPYETREVAP